jgi:hypothetical protein
METVRSFPTSVCRLSLVVQGRSLYHRKARTIVQSHVVEIYAPTRQNPKRADRIRSPEAAAVVRWIVEIPWVIQHRSEGK